MNDVEPEIPEGREVAGRYVLRSVLGHGTMGTVWSAYDEFLHRGVAVKEMRLPPGFPPERAEELRERTLREARAIAALSHPNVITLYDVVREGDEPFVVMELFTARSLAGLIAEHGPLTTHQAATVGEAVAAALQAAHAAEITHRDVKPANVLVSRDGRVKLSDFGIARNMRELTITASGIMLGSPAYMAPEVASGKKVTAAADLWGLGALLYAAVEGRPPYDVDDDPLATAHAVVNDPVPEPSPGPLAEIIVALMAKDPQARPPIEEIHRQLHDLAGKPGGRLFDEELFESAPDAEGRTTASRPTGQTESAGTAPLASDPGPLPFQPSPPRGKPRRRPLAATTVALLATALFAVAGAAGFVAARILGGADVLPARVAENLTRSAPDEYELQTRHGDAATFLGDTTGRFRVKVPQGWSTFASQQTSSVQPPSTLVQYVSPSGSEVVEVERFLWFFTDHDIDGYLAGLRASWPATDFILVSRDEAEMLTYRTVDAAYNEPGAQPQSTVPRMIGRTSFARLVRDDTTLWVVRVTVPADQETRGRTDLFDQIAPTFAVE